MSRPELQAPPEIFYNEEEARKYTRNSRIMEIQSELSHRALELLALPEDGVPRLLLDIGIFRNPAAHLSIFHQKAKRVLVLFTEQVKKLSA